MCVRVYVSVCLFVSLYMCERMIVYTCMYGCVCVCLYVLSPLSSDNQLAMLFKCSQRTVNEWNRLSGDCVSASNMLICLKIKSTYI